MTRGESRNGPAGGPGDALPVEDALTLEHACDRFEAAWRAGDRPGVEDALGGLGPALRAVAVRELVQLDVYYRRRAGEAPRAADYRDRFPDLDQGWLADAVGGEAAAGGADQTT